MLFFYMRQTIKTPLGEDRDEGCQQLKQTSKLNNLQQLFSDDWNNFSNKAARTVGAN